MVEATNQRFFVTQVPHLNGINGIDELIAHYTPLGGVVTMGDHETRYFIVRLARQQRIHFYELDLSARGLYHATFRSEGNYDQHSPYFNSRDARLLWKYKECNILPEYKGNGQYFGVGLKGADKDGEFKEFWRVVFPDGTWVLTANEDETRHYIDLNIAAHQKGGAST